MLALTFVTIRSSSSPLRLRLAVRRSSRYVRRRHRFACVDVRDDTFVVVNVTSALSRLTFGRSGQQLENDDETATTLANNWRTMTRQRRPSTHTMIGQKDTEKNTEKIVKESAQVDELFNARLDSGYTQSLDALADTALAR